ncbi:MAG: cytochrome C biogenesis protein [Legionellales bacterium]|jgi:cytochrome c-type biogenesis protein CcmH|nr:cytochrome C biogenesis protein [Legionellales bacterium]OUX64941.1 MAG: hypothetical protein CBE41_02375 [Gammaproteobacteria bacterium TMED281]|tara:strand:+ start:121 stop:504 length:384 start_codon:yes stop_codon:yes gene_type:complete
MLTQLFKTLNILIMLTPIYAAELYPFENQADRQHFYQLISNIRCLVCQNESIADSNAKLASDLREHVYTDVLLGKSDTEILTFLTSRYGNFVRYSPPFDWITLLLWGAPIPIAMLSLWLLRRFIYNE